MKAKIDLNEKYSTKILKNQNFGSLLTFVLNEDGLISEFWIENQVINNDEQTFRELILDSIKQAFLEEFSDLNFDLQVVYSDSMMASSLYSPTPQENDLRYIAKLTEFEG